MIFLRRRALKKVKKGRYKSGNFLFALEKETGVPFNTSKNVVKSLAISVTIYAADKVRFE